MNPMRARLRRIRQRLTPYWLHHFGGDIYRPDDLHRPRLGMTELDDPRDSADGDTW